MIKAYQQKPFEFRHEEKSLREILNVLHKTYPKDKDLYLFVNIKLPHVFSKSPRGYTPDIIALSENGINVIEMKNWYGKVTIAAKQNEWLRDDKPLEGQIHPYDQTRRNAYATLGFIEAIKDHDKNNFKDLLNMKINKTVLFVNPNMDIVFSDESNIRKILKQGDDVSITTLKKYEGFNHFQEWIQQPRVIPSEYDNIGNESSEKRDSSQ